MYSMCSILDAVNQRPIRVQSAMYAVHRLYAKTTNRIKAIIIIF